jgi:two-component system response regulator AtoC
MKGSEPTGKTILIVDDEEGIRHGLENLFRRRGNTVRACAGYQEAIEAATRVSIDAAVLDIRLKNSKSGIDLLRELKRIDPDMVVIMITGYGSIDSAVTCMKEGAADYVLKPIDNLKLLDAVHKNLKLRSLKSENVYLRSELMSRCLADRVITRDPALEAVVARADKIKNSPVTVLLTGESGTGKEVLASYLHYSSNRREAQFVSINCAALSESLLLSELFGHEKGAFTGAIERKLGKFQIAGGGTLFLDEIGDMPINIQAKLLRVIEESSFERVGGTQRIEVNVRIIAATNQNLEKLINEGRFREDLYYRINVVAFKIPPLRERSADIPLLAGHFLGLYARRYNKRAARFSPEALQALTAADWPGNVRELENVVNQAVLLSEEEIIGIDGLKQNLNSRAPDPPGPVDIAGVTSLKQAVAEVTEQQEKAIIAQALLRCGGNKSQTARSLDITRKTLARKIEKYRL